MVPERQEEQRLHLELTLGFGRDRSGRAVHYATCTVY